MYGVVCLQPVTVTRSVLWISRVTRQLVSARVRTASLVSRVIAVPAAISRVDHPSHLASVSRDENHTHQFLQRRVEWYFRVGTHWMERSNVSARRMALTLWRPLLPYWYSYKASRARPVWAVMSNFWHPGTLTLRAGTGCFVAVPIWQQRASKG